MILEEMFNGRFYPCETVVADSPRFKQAVKASAALMDTLSERLSKEDYALVEELRAQVAIAQCEENESHFKYGFSAVVCTPSRGQRNKSTKKYLNLPSNNDHAFPSVSKRQGYAGDVSCCSNGYNCESFSPVQYDS